MGRKFRDGVDMKGRLNKRTCLYFYFAAVVRVNVSKENVCGPMFLFDLIFCLSGAAAVAVAAVGVV